MAGGTDRLREFIREQIGPYDFIFIQMPFRQQDDFLLGKIRVAAKEAGWNCVRADDIQAHGYLLSDVIHTLIVESKLVISEITSQNPNVLYEVGYAIAKDKDVLLLIEEPAQPVSDLQGILHFRYSLVRAGVDEFHTNLRDVLRSLMDPSVRTLRDMLIPIEPLDMWIVSSPKSRTLKKPSRGPWDNRTFGDHTGILGLITAFGQLLGEKAHVELVSARPIDDGLKGFNAHFFLIGSPKVNDMTESKLKEIQEGATVEWVLRPIASEEGKPEETLDPDYELIKTVDGVKHHPCYPNCYPEPDANYGVIVRGPFDETSPQKICMVLAGGNAVGTAAACLAATRSSLIMEIQRKLGQGVELADSSTSIWVLVKGVWGVNKHGKPQDKADGHLYPEGVTILDAGVYIKR